MANAFVLAAGFGTRLKPLTLHRPKPLVPVCGVPMLSYCLAHCARDGFQKAIVNAHHLAEQLEGWQGVHEGVEVQVVVEAPDILGTGGGLKAVESALAERYVVVNGDVLCDVDLKALCDAVPEGGGAMALRPHPQEATERYGVVAMDEGGRVVDLKGMARAECVGRLYEDSHFTGIHAMDRAMLRWVPQGFSCVVRTAYIHLVPQRKVAAVRHSGTWLDVGDPSSYLETNLAVLEGRVSLAIDPFLRAGWARRANGEHVGAEGPVPRGVGTGPVWLGQGVEIGQDCELNRTVVGDNAVIASGSTLNQCVVWDGCRVEAGEWNNTVFFGGSPLIVG